MRIYTKTGDSGTAGLVGGSRASKDDVRFQALGDLDELNAVLGALISDCPTQRSFLENIQNLLFCMGAEVASPEGESHQFVTSADIDGLERAIDDMETVLPPLKSFILPGGCRASAGLHVARAVCRRAERSLVALHQGAPQRRELLAFLNRLSDWLFVAARYENHQSGTTETPWRPPQ